jgi:hypothetical protein
MKRGFDKHVWNDLQLECAGSHEEKSRGIVHTQ